MERRARPRTCTTANGKRIAVAILMIFSALPGLNARPAKAQAISPVAAICEVLRSPDRFDKQTIQLRGDVHLDFEDFSLSSTACPNDWPGIWLAFGGDTATPTMSTVNDTVRQPGATPRFGGIPVLLTKDDNFELFFALISARKSLKPLYRVQATLTGTFLAGNRTSRADGKAELPGYGHMGAFHLFVISRVNAVDADPPPQVDVSGLVTDATGTQIAAVDVYSQTVNCCRPQVKQVRSDERGHFAIRNAGQVLTFLKTGYRPQSLVLVTGRSDVHVALENTPADDWRISECNLQSKPVRFSGLPLSVLIPPGFRHKHLPDTPYPLFVIERKSDRQFIRLSRGQSQGPFGLVSARIFVSENFVQRHVLDTDGKTIGIDSSGEEANKRFWRIVTLSGKETVEYSNVPRETADAFDSIIVSACFGTP